MDGSEDGSSEGKSPEGPAGVMCGRHPNLFPCQSEDIARMHNCSMWPTPELRDARPRLFDVRKRCNVSRPPAHCYHEHAEGWGDFFCCGTGQDRALGER